MRDVKTRSVFIKVICLAGLFAFVCTPRVGADADIPENILRVSVADAEPSCNLNAAEGFTLYDLNSGARKTMSGRSIYLVKPRDKGLSIGGEPWGMLVRAMARDGDFIRVNGRRYRGTILIRKTGRGELTAINELGIDEYLFGILPREVSPAWPKEALKAQALVSRSFALKSLGRHGSDGFDLCSKVHCQVYGGMESEDARTNAAVEETYNEVVVYKEDLANTLFFSNCGGKTEFPGNAWQNSNNPPYLKPVRCKYCKGFKHHDWEESVKSEQMADALGKFSVEYPIRSITVANKGSSGRAATIKIRSAAGNATLPASQFRMAIGPNVIRSTMITRIRRKGDRFLFEGRGWGHGVGLCQEGARGMAERNKSYRKIVQFYYPGTEIEKVEN